MVSALTHPTAWLLSAPAAANGSASSVLPQPPLVANATQPEGVMNHINPGALMRGSVVFGVLCVLVVLYIAFRTCR